MANGWGKPVGTECRRQLGDVPSGLRRSLAYKVSDLTDVPCGNRIMPMNRSRSRDAFERACRVIPGGVNSPARAFGAVGGSPLFIARGEGPHLYDIDGNKYLDYIGSWGPLILGHAHPRVVAAVEEVVRRGAS